MDAPGLPLLGGEAGILPESSPAGWPPGLPNGTSALQTVLCRRETSIGSLEGLGMSIGGRIMACLPSGNSRWTLLCSPPYHWSEPPSMCAQTCVCAKASISIMLKLPGLTFLPSYFVAEP